MRLYLINNMNKLPDSKDKESFSKPYSDYDIKREALKSGAISIMAKIGGVVLHFISVVILARLLSPDDFGLYAMASVFISLFFLFQDVGLTDATIQAPFLNHKILSSLFWINIGIGFIIAVVLSLLAPVAVLFFHRKELLPLILVSAIEFIFWGFSFQHTALMKRRFQFARVNLISLVSFFFGVSVAIVSAVLGMRYWALVFRGLATASCNSFMTWFICKWRPGKPSKSPEVSKLVKFGLNSVGFYIVNYFSNYMDKTIIGKKFGSELLGFYSRAYYIAVTPSSSLGQALFHVAVSTLSKLRDDIVKFKKYYYNALFFLSFIGMPFAVLIVILNKEIVYILLGPKWSLAAKYFAILGLSSGMNIIYQTSSWLHVSLGRSDRWLKWGVISSAILIAGFLVGAQFGIVGIAWAYSIFIFLFTIPSILYAGQPASISLSLISKAIKNNALASAFSGLIFWQIKTRFLNNFNAILIIIFSIFIFTFIYIIMITIFHQGFKPIIDLRNQLKSLFLSKHNTK